MIRFQNSAKVPIPTLERLATYLTALTNLIEHGIDTVSSTQIESLTGINAAQFRKDLSYFGEFGRPGVGYSVDQLQAGISAILNLSKTQSVILVGAGNLGSALAGYPALKAENFKIVAVFDNSPSKVGKTLWDLTIAHMSEMVEVNSVLNARIGIIAVPARAAQEVAELLVKAGVVGILNFAPVWLHLPPEVSVRHVDFVQELAVLSFYLKNEERNT
jgi:redox-sensing transcriptional repressor